MIAVRDHLNRFGDATIAVVTFADPHRLAAYRAHLQIPFSTLSDIDRAMYTLLGAGRGTARQIWSLATLRTYARLIRGGKRLHHPTEDINQLGADVVIGRNGRIRYIALPATPNSRPPIADLIEALD